MLSLPGRKGLRAQTLATRLGCEVGETVPSMGWSEPGVSGATGEVAVWIQAAGGRWCSREAAHLFPSWSTLEEVLEEIIQNQGARRQ